MAAKRVKLCFDALPIRSKDSLRHWTPKAMSNACRCRHLSTETISNASSAEPIRHVIPQTRESRPFPVISSVPAHLQQPTVTTTLHHFPTLEPLRFIEYPHNHLSLPLRKDILHRAVVYEGDMTRQGTAATKHRFEIHGSNRKLRPQKGTGRARLGDRSSPMLRGGGRAFDKKARDFSTGLQRKVYDLAWRTALSYRYRKGELLVVDSLAVGEGKDWAENTIAARSWIEQMFPRLGWQRKGGGSLLLGADNPGAEDEMNAKIGLFLGLVETRGWGRGLMVEDVDVKDLLKSERIVVEKKALDQMLKYHQSDLKKTYLEPIKSPSGSRW